MSSTNQYLKPRHKDLKEKIEHIVVVMLENRSFDNMLGWLYDGKSPPRGQQFEGLTWNIWNPLDNIDSDGNPFVEKVGIRKNGQEYKIGKKRMPAEFTGNNVPTDTELHDFLHGAYHEVFHQK